MSEFQTKHIKATIKALAIFDANNVTMTAKECAKFLNKNERTIARWIAKGKIKAQEINGNYIIPKIQFLTQITSTWENE